MSKLATYYDMDFGTVRVRYDDESRKCMFAASDVTHALGYRNTHDAVKRHCKAPEKYPTPTNGGVQMLSFISEGDVYRLVAQSKLLNAKRFESWVFDEVLPSLRRHGAYVMDEILRDSSKLSETLEELQRERKLRREIEHINERNKKVLNDMIPKLTYHDKVLKTTNTVPVTVIAKDYGMSAIRFNMLLNLCGIQYRTQDTWVLYQKYADKGYTATTTVVIGETISKVHTCWTQKGRQFLYHELARHGILPHSGKEIEEYEFTKK